MKKIIIFDFNRTIYDPDKDKIIDGVINKLEYFYKKKYILYLISRNENSQKRLEILNIFDIKKYFKEIYFVENKTPEIFLSILEKENINPENVYVIGDYLYEEIRFGNMAGLNTIWFKNGKFKNLNFKIKEDKPDLIISNFKDLNL